MLNPSRALLDMCNLCARTQRQLICIKCDVNKRIRIHTGTAVVQPCSEHGPTGRGDGAVWRGRGCSARGWRRNHRLVQGYPGGPQGQTGWQRPHGRELDLFLPNLGLLVFFAICLFSIGDFAVSSHQSYHCVLLMQIKITFATLFSTAAQRHHNGK